MAVGTTIPAAAATAASDRDCAPTPLVLASASAIRQALLRQAGLEFDICAAGIDEGAIKREAATAGRTAGETALELARRKALAAVRPGAFVVGCDQILVCDGEWFDKPADLDVARRHLLRLRGRAHDLETAIVVLQDGMELWCHLETPRLAMRDFSADFLEWYVATEGAHLLKAVGGYRLEGPGIQLFTAIEGDHFAVLGLPVLPLLGFLRGRDMIMR